MDWKYDPGTKEAVQEGCTCPIWDNHNGAGIGVQSDGSKLFWLVEGCPVHCPKIEKSCRLSDDVQQIMMDTLYNKQEGNHMTTGQLVQEIRNGFNITKGRPVPKDRADLTVIREIFRHSKDCSCQEVKAFERKRPIEAETSKPCDDAKFFGTVCLLYYSDDTYSIGHSLLHPRDLNKFNRKVGRAIAKGRAMKLSGRVSSDIQHGKATRQEFSRYCQSTIDTYISSVEESSSHAKLLDRSA